MCFRFIHSFVHSFIHSFVRSFIHSFIHQSIHQFIHQSIHQSVQPAIHPSRYIISFAIYSSIHHPSIHSSFHRPVHPSYIIPFHPIRRSLGPLMPSLRFAYSGKTYPDFLGFFIGLIMTVILAAGVQKSVRFNNVLNAVNFIIWMFIMIAGMVYMDGDNWKTVGFAPYGASGVSYHWLTFFKVELTHAAKPIYSDHLSLASAIFLETNCP